MEHQQSEETEDNVNWQQRCRRRKQFTRNWNVHDIGSSLDENNYKEIVFMTKKCWTFCSFLCCSLLFARCSLLFVRCFFSAFMGNCQIISHTCHCYLASRWVLYIFVSGVTQGNEEPGWVQDVILEERGSKISSFNSSGVKLLETFFEL